MGDKFYLVVEGQAKATVSKPAAELSEGGDDSDAATGGANTKPRLLPPLVAPTAETKAGAIDAGEATVMEYGPGAYFGEVALLRRCPRRVNVIACGRTKCAEMDTDRYVDPCARAGPHD